VSTHRVDNLEESTSGAGVTVKGLKFGTAPPNGVDPMVEDNVDRAVNYPAATTGIGTRIFDKASRQSYLLRANRLYVPISDSPVDHVSSRSFVTKDWVDANGIFKVADNIKASDDATRYLTAGEIAAHPEWACKYIAGVNVRDDVLPCESSVRAYANQGVNMRGVIANVTDIGGGQTKVDLTPDAVDLTNPDVVRSKRVAALPLMGAGLFAEGVRGAAFYTVDGNTKFILHMVQDNTATSVTFSESGTIYKPAIGDRFELIQFNGSAFSHYNRRVELNGSYQLTRAIPIQHTIGATWIGHGKLNTKLNMNTKDMPHFLCNGMAYSKFKDFATLSNVSSNRAQFEVDWTSFAVGNSGAAVSSQSNTWENFFWGGWFTGNLDRRLGAPAAGLAITAVGGNWIEFTAPRNLLLNELNFCWCVEDTATDARRVGFRQLVSGHPAANAGATVRVSFWYPFAGMPAGVGDTVFFEIGSHMAVEQGYGRTQVNGSTGPQCSENKYTHGFCGGFTTGGFGSITGNALQQGYDHINFSNCPNWMIWHFWGNAHITDCSGQAGADPIHNQISYMRGNPNNYGTDVKLSNANAESSVMTGWRSESARMVYNDGAQKLFLRASSVSGQIIGSFPLNQQWEAGKAVKSTGVDIGLPTMTPGSFGPHRDGTLYFLAQVNGAAGVSQTSAGPEPQWDTSGAAVGNPGYGYRYIDEPNAGAGGADTLRWMEWSTWISWLQGNQKYYALQIGGSLIDYSECTISYGQVQVTGNRVGSLFFNRKDVFADTAAQAGLFIPATLQGQNWEMHGEKYFNDPANPPRPSPTWGMFAGAFNAPFEGYPHARYQNVAPTLKVMGSSGTDKVVNVVGWGPGAQEFPLFSPYGRRNTDADNAWNNDIYIGSPAPHNISPRLNWNDLTGLANVAGKSTWLIGGPGRGSGVGGPAKIGVSPAGAAGTQVNPPIEVGRFDLSAVAGDTRFMLWDVTTGALVRVTRGAADSGGAGFRVLRIPN
jgi:hypothetical protein